MASSTWPRQIRTAKSTSRFLGNGDGTFGPATNFAVGPYPYSVAISDLNGDGKPDLAVVVKSPNIVSIFLGDGTGSFGGATNFAVGAGPYSLAVGDLNGDGKPDLAVANFSDSTVSVMLNTTANVVTTANSKLLVADFGDSTIKQFSGTTGAFERNLVAPGAGGLQSPIFLH